MLEGGHKVWWGGWEEEAGVNRYLYIRTQDKRSAQQESAAGTHLWLLLPVCRGPVATSVQSAPSLPCDYSTPHEAPGTANCPHGRASTMSFKRPKLGVPARERRLER